MAVISVIPVPGHLNREGGATHYYLMHLGEGMHSLAFYMYIGKGIQLTELIHSYFITLHLNIIVNYTYY